MTVFNAERVVIKYLAENGSYSAVSLLGNNLYNNLVFLTPYPDIVAYEMIDKHALLINIDNQNFILGYYIDEYEVGRDMIYLEGEKLIKMGEARGMIFGDDGYVGIYQFKRNNDGSITRTPLVEYSAKNELKASYASLLSTLSDSSASFRVEKDELGYNHVEMAAKGHGNDPGNRMQASIKGTGAGMDLDIAIDLTPTPIGGVPGLPIDMQLKSLSIKASPLAPLSIVYDKLGPQNMNITMDVKGVITISTGPLGAGPQIILDPAMPDSVTIKTDAIGAGSITMNKMGAITIDAKAGIEIKGLSTGLLATLISFMGEYVGHMHPSSMGPTGGPLLPKPSGVKALTDLNIIKGSAQ